MDSGSLVAGPVGPQVHDSFALAERVPIIGHLAAVPERSFRYGSDSLVTSCLHDS